tara:strand:- start:174 stop:722 length:549 start_codon:yes stop_codon:yes gene_type:complete
MGVEPKYTLDWSFTDTIWYKDQQDEICSDCYYLNWSADTVFNESNPDEWDGFWSLENSKGTSIADSNFVLVTPGYNVDEESEKPIQVVPNPYIVHSGFNESEYLKKIRFTHLPAQCEITIFTITGEKVFTINKDNDTDANAWWDLRSDDNKEVAPGLYLFVVEDKTEDSKKENFIGKFAIVR